ncbi:sigma-54-dependent transcriptional regulator [Pseudoalteromonas tunicata]|uniref:sigma-54-dependent transcriptional regulator n=1 Tax=Pseudoalteromonas tunicata TaxID=314281 RepID=UPI00273D6FF6|nr:sigma-54 dependent transcriptional regulator [Pseudoalteromonas tunicata]MDP4985537.1 sigma-54 dependent transcriptional regulator [Pseudoalteromonas tunicata]MDP5212910.1 sigma-54 dependent transcriptional regulator [Pseudoalteromonas tunicata]
MTAKVLIVEDTESLALIYQSYLVPTGIKSMIANTGQAALDFLAEHTPELILLDIMLPDMNGMDILASLEHVENRPQVVVLTGHGSKELAVQAIRLGATDFLEKPIDAERFRVTVNNALKIKVLSEKVSSYQNQYSHGRFCQLIGSSKIMQSVYQIINSAAVSKATVFITGESGTGKELCAGAVHQCSPRSKAPFIALNCAAIPKDLIESEIFGHVKGAFTGATNNREGAAGQAQGGTLFLDEICEMDLNLQSKLLRFIQTGTFQKVGSEKLEKVDVRFVCATNRDPLIEVNEGRFREDLFYRLHVIPILLPPLKERGNDVIEIADFLFKKISKEEHKSYQGMAKTTEQYLANYDWPGNVRQLENVVRNTVVLNNSPWIEVDMLPQLNQLQSTLVPELPSQNLNAVAPAAKQEGYHFSGEIEPLWLAEKRYIEQAIALTNDNIPRAAAMLEVSPSTIYRKMKQWQEML